MTTTQLATKTPAARGAAPAAADAIAILEADHKAVGALFAAYEKAHATTGRKALVAQVCEALSLHMQIEEEVFYPAVKGVLKDKMLVPEASVEHGTMKALIAELEGVDPDGKMYDAKVKVLSEYVQHHVKEEHDEMFPQVRASSLDLGELGARMTARRDDLVAHSG